MAFVLFCRAKRSTKAKMAMRQGVYRQLGEFQFLRTYVTYFPHTLKIKLNTRLGVRSEFFLRSVGFSTGPWVILTVFLGPVTFFIYQTLLHLITRILFFPVLFLWEITILLFDFAFHYRSYILKWMLERIFLGYSAWRHALQKLFRSSEISHQAHYFLWFQRN